MALELWSTLKEAIVAYTGLSPPTFFTLLAILFAIYYIVSGLFGSDNSNRHGSSRDFETQMEPLKPPVQIGEVTEEDLKAYDGSDPEKPLLMAIKGQIYDVSHSRYKTKQKKKELLFLLFGFDPFVLCDFGFWVCFCLLNRTFCYCGYLFFY